MTPAAVLSPRAAAFERIKALVLDTLPSAESKRAYGQALDDFFRWSEAAAADEPELPLPMPAPTPLSAPHTEPEPARAAEPSKP